MELAVGASQATLKSLLTKLGSLLADEYALIRGVRGDVQFITDELASMQAFLGNLSKCNGGHDDQTEDWMKQIRDVAYDIEVCIDDFAHGLRPDPRGSGWFTAVRRTLYEIQTWSTRRAIAAQIVELKIRAQHVGERRARYGVRDPQPSEADGFARLTAHNAAEHQHVSRQLTRVKQPVGVDMPDLENWLASEAKRKKTGVLSIVGFGGVGKTTIALALYQKLGPQFERRAMVTVSQTSDLEMVLRNIVSQLQQQDNNGEQHAKGSPMAKTTTFGSILSKLRLPSQSQEGVLEKHRQIQADLKKYLGENRYLLLIDDVWSSSSWLYIKKCFPENDKGSRIIVTTRIQAVANTCSSCKDNDRVHKADVLSDNEAQKLFDKALNECKNAGGGQLNRREVPERVWKMCGGLPLAVITMAGLVVSRPQMTHKDWTNKVCNFLFPDSQVCGKPEEFMRIINHCYNDLDSDLKTCSLYLSIFPKGRKISRKRLTRRWIAEGFINEKQGLTVEDVAETCFNQLIERKIIRPVEHSSSGRVKSCQVHDMVLEYLISKAAEEDFITVVGSHWSTLPTHSNKVRRLAVHSSDSNRARQVDSINLSHVRSLTVFESLDKLHFKSFKTRIVQVLDLHGCRGFRESHVKVSDICEMILLKYLGLRRTDIKQLPQNIHKLKYLETLDIRETEVQHLPATVGQLERIKNILGGDKRTRKTLKLPKELKGTIKTLHILSGVEIVDGSTAASDLSYFTGLRKLAIYKIHKKDEIFNDLLSSIQYLSGYSLQSLVIDDESSEFLKNLDTMSSYPTDLTALELSGRLLRLPKWISMLSKLVKLTLSATALRTDNLQLLSSLGSLFSLTFSISEKKDPALAAILEGNKSASGEIYVPAGGFSMLKLLRIFVPVLPSLNFAKEATPQLERIELRFNKLEGLHGIDELKILHDVLLTVDGKQSDRTKLVLQGLRERKKRSSKYTVIVNEYHHD